MAENKVQSITNQLWSMANELRGNMDAADYQTYILGFMFYRYLSEHQEQYLVEQEIIDVEPNQSINDAYQKEVVSEGAAEYLEAISDDLGYAILPEDTWQTIVTKVNENTLIPEDFQNMFDHFNDNVNLNKSAKQDFSGIFSDLNLGNSRLGSNTNDRTKSLSKIINLVNNFDYNDEDGHDVLGDVYEYLIAKFASNSGKKAGEFYTPHEVSEVLAKLVTINLEKNDEPFQILDPAMGSGSLLLTVQDEVPNGQKKGKVQFFGQELNTTTYNLARMNLMMHGVDYSNMTLRNGDTLESDWPDGLDKDGIEQPRFVDAVVENPPYSAHWDNNEGKLKDPRFKEAGVLPPKTKADYAFLLHSLYHLKNDGTMAIVLPHGVLFRGNTEGKIRKQLLESNQIDAIIGLPEKLFYSTSIPTTVLVLKKTRTNRGILFIDASKDFEKGKNQNNLTDENINKIIETYKNRSDVERYAHVVSIDEIKENDFNLNIPRYVDTFEPEPEIDLQQEENQIAEIDQEISKVEAEFNEMKEELRWIDGDQHE